MNYVLKEANDEKLDQKEWKDKVINLQKQMGKTTLKLGTLKISDSLNMKRLKEEHKESLNTAKKNGTRETIEEPDKLSQILEDIKVML